MALVEVLQVVLAKELCNSVIAKHGAVVRTIGDRASGSHRSPSNPQAYFAMVACSINVDGTVFAVAITSYQDVMGSNSQEGSSTFRDYLKVFEVLWARIVKVVSPKKIVVREPKALSSLLEV